MTKIKDMTDYDTLAARAERGDLKITRRIYEGDGCPIDLADIFMTAGRPRDGKGIDRVMHLEDASHR